MELKELESSTSFKLVRILNTLREHYGIHLDFNKSNFDTLMQVHEQCLVTQHRIVESASHNTYHDQHGYKEAGLIQEAIQLFLSEVAPARYNRRLRKNQSCGANNE